MIGNRTRRPSTRWYVEIDESGRVSVLKRGREVLTGSSMSEARRYLRSNMRKGDEAFSVAPDGYRTRL